MLVYDPPCSFLSTMGTGIFQIVEGPLAEYVNEDNAEQVRLKISNDT